MKISIIIPIYKVEQEICACLESVIQQSYQNIELILVNDATPDNSFVLARHYLDQSNFTGTIIFIEHAENKGLSQARNSGIQKATGDYLFFLDSDDQIADASVISSLFSEAQDKNYPDIVQGMAQYFIDGHYLPIKIRQIPKYLEQPQLFELYSRGRIPTTAWGKLVKRQLILNKNLYFMPGVYYEDDLWSFYLYQSAQTYTRIDSIVYSYLVREGSITQSSITSKKLADLALIIDRVYTEYKQNPKEVGRVINRLKRTLLKYLFSSTDRDLRIEYLRLLFKYPIPLFSSWDLRYIEQNIILRLPIQWILRYGQNKWSKSK